MDRIQRPVTPEKVEEFVKKYGRSASHTLNYLGKNSRFLTAISSEIGAALLEEDIERWDHLFDRIAKMDASDQEKVEFLYLTKRIEKVSIRVSKYLEEERKITKS